MLKPARRKYSVPITEKGGFQFPLKKTRLRDSLQIANMHTYDSDACGSL